MRRSLSGRRAVKVTALALAVVAMGITGYRGFFDHYLVVPASDFTDVVERLPTHAGEVWDNTLDRAQGLPGVVLTSSDICGDAVCRSSWGLFLMGQDPAVHSVFAQVNVYAARKANRLSAAWGYLNGPHREWEPYQSIEHKLSATDIAGHADSVRFSCYSYQDQLHEDSDCLWSYYARYGQYVVGILYGSDGRPIGRDQFIEEYVLPFDQVITRLLDLDSS